MLVRAHAFSVDRGSAGYANVELDLRAGLPGLTVIGLPGGSARDVRERVQAAVLNSGFPFPRRRVTVNIAPPSRRGGSEFDLAVACCALAVTGVLDPGCLEFVGLSAELSLGGELRSCHAAAPTAALAARIGLQTLVVAAGDVDAARGGSDIAVAGRRTLRDVVALLEASARRRGPTVAPRGPRPSQDPVPARSLGDGGILRS